jgi:hypothetical protein
LGRPGRVQNARFSLAFQQAPAPRAAQLSPERRNVRHVLLTEPEVTRIVGYTSGTLEHWRIHNKRSTHVSPRRTIAKHRNGMSKEERERLSAAVHYMRSHGRLMHVSVEAHEGTEYEARQRIDRVKADFGQTQVRAGGSRFYVEVLESSPTVHSHIIGLTPKGSRPEHIIARLKNSKVYGDGMKAVPSTTRPAW